VAAHMRARGYAREECVGVGDSAEDLDVAEVVGRLFLVANAVAGDTSRFSNVERTEAAMSEGFYEAVIRALAERL
jgi:hydroxymethylpyrimidine pyrophosphatase-like HAD family hydrolase